MADWIAPVCALLGVALGIFAARLGDQRRRQWEAHRSAFEARFHAYVEFLTALESTAHDLLDVLRSTEPPERRRSAAQNAFTAHGLGAIRQRIHVLAPPGIIDAADAVFRALRVSIEYVATMPADPPDLQQQKDHLGHLRDRLHQLIRQDLGT
ncbi:hypothetical protein OG455_00110 [Kitasatospora sp. NBC_01287]|uniref:hypothetical protein n=1 Tax=Kitasatospora sp. NBC_01287 TaxID=2903573 RepID=UPI00224DA21E|nr:hypothetical protein [Kitasatospora sp. NBC_01287]MCX4743931.1 hypothetical protein [Kitasatospora sp. NBC_01287]